MMNYRKLKEDTTMVQLIVGEKGKGKTKYLLDKVNTAIKTANGNIVYLDKSRKHMYELNNKVRLIDVTEYPIQSSDEFVGFICGIVSQDHDLEEMYLDSFLKVAYIDGTDVLSVIKKLQHIGEQFDVNFVVSMSIEEKDVPEELKPMIIVSL